MFFLGDEMVTERDMLSLYDVCAVCNAQYQAVRRWIKSGRLQARKIGKQWLVHPAHLQDFAKNQMVLHAEKSRRYERAVKAMEG